MLSVWKMGDAALPQSSSSSSTALMFIVIKSIINFVLKEDTFDRRGSDSSDTTILGITSKIWTENKQCRFN